MLLEQRAGTPTGPLPSMSARAERADELAEGRITKVPRPRSVLAVILCCAVIVTLAISGDAFVSPLQDRPAPELADTTWINSAPLKLKELRGKVVLLEFWTYG